MRAGNPTEERMQPPNLSKILSLIPGRRARRLSGTPFNPAAGRQGSQFAHVAPLLGWTSPLVFLTKEEQQALGLVAPQGRASQDDEPQEEEEPELEPV
jgi:hypothetical protein